MSTRPHPAALACWLALAAIGPAQWLPAQELPPLAAEEGAWPIESYLADNCLDCGEGVVYEAAPGFFAGWWPDIEPFHWRHSSTHGRATGQGQPLRGTSWLNRPFEFGLETGAFVMTDSLSPNTNRNNDLLGAAHLGWDWDHYWGTQFRLAWTSPELARPGGESQGHSNDVLIGDLSLLYYPWGDSRIRPYWRAGVGLTDIGFTAPSGVFESNSMLTIPLGIGIKYQTQRWMAFRAEMADYITIGQNSARTVQNLLFTFGLEWRFGGRPNSTWSSPSKRPVW